MDKLLGSSDSLPLSDKKQDLSSFMEKNSPEGKTLQQQFGSTIRTVRTQLGITQQELADRADMQRTYLADVERGMRNLALTNITRLTKALDVPTSRFFAQMERRIARRSQVDRLSTRRGAG